MSVLVLGIFTIVLLVRYVVYVSFVDVVTKMHPEAFSFLIKVIFFFCAFENL